MIRLSRELQQYFVDKGVDLENLSRQVSPPSDSKRLQVRQPLQVAKGPSGKQTRVRSILNYILGFRELRGSDKLIVLATLDAYANGSFYQAKTETIGVQLSCSRATVFRSLKRIVPKWVVKAPSRSGKPNILKPSPMLLKYLGLVAKKGQVTSGDRSKGRLKQCHRITGTFRRFPRI